MTLRTPLYAIVLHLLALDAAASLPEQQISITQMANAGALLMVVSDSMVSTLTLPHQ